MALARMKRKIMGQMNHRDDSYAASAGYSGGPPQDPIYGPVHHAPVYYATNQSQQLVHSYETRKRAAYNALNEFFGNTKGYKSSAPPI